MSYDEWEEVYRQDPVLPWELGKPRRQLVEAVERGWIRSGRALDICCGLGTNALYLAKKGFQVSGIDVSKTAIKRAVKKANRDEAVIDYLVGNAVHLPFHRNVFNFIFDMGCFHHIMPVDRGSYLHGVRRVLMDDGKYLVVCFSSLNGPAWNHFTKKEIREIFSPFFKIEKTEEFSSVEGDGVTRHFHSIFMRK